MKLTTFMKQSKLVKKREIKGIFYIAPFMIGFLAFIFIPMVQSVIYAFNELTFNGQTTSLKGVGFNNFIHAFTVDTEFREVLLSSVTDMVINVPIILIFSLLIANFLNGRFAGKSTFQIIFFIPVIVSSGIMPALFSGNIISNAIMGAESMTTAETAVFDTTAMSEILMKMNLNADFVGYIMYAVTNILEVLSSSGIQILVFLMALMAIPKSLFEAANVEGASSWEAFWKITFPMIMPQMLVNIVYTVIDAFTDNQNAVMKSITQYNFTKFQFGYAASLAWVYFLFIIVILAVFVLIYRSFTRDLT